MRLSDFIATRVVDTEGNRLGHVFDVTTEWRDGSLHVRELEVGRRGLLVRLGYRRAGSRVPWSRLVGPRREQLVVRAED